MIAEPRHSSRTRRMLIACALCVAMALIFVADTVTEYAVAAAVFHTAIILVAVRWFSARTVVALTIACILLTLGSFALTPAGLYHVGLINTAISILAIAITAYLGLKMVAAQAAAHAAQARLLRIARATSLGELTASIAHEINQPLAAIVTSGHACQRWLAQQPPQLDKAGHALQRILGDAERASNVITRIRGMARGDAPRKQRLDLGHTVREIIELSRSELDRRGIALQWALPPGLPAVWADPVHVQQVVGNLLLNAIDAIDAAGAHSPDSAAPPSSSTAIAEAVRQIAIGGAHQDATHVAISVTDSGTGLSHAVTAHLFDAFWTTKRDGMGLGLTLSRTMIEANGGRIWATARSDGHRGAVFHFSLPVAAQEPR